MSGEPVLGLDIGGVVILRSDDRDDDTSFFGDAYLDTPAVAGAPEAIRELSAGTFAGRVHLVSKCGEPVEARTRAWLDHHRFLAAAAIDPANVHFCRERADKAPICAALGVTHFVDDRADVLSYLDGVPHRFLFTGGGAPAGEVASGALTAASWPELVAAIRGSLRR